MKKLFKSKYTKWIPLGRFTYGSYEHITLARKNTRNGMIYFKTKRVNGWFFVMMRTNPFMPTNLIDTQKAWEEINNI